jgi:hypothetical protein
MTRVRGIVAVLCVLIAFVAGGCAVHVGVGYRVSQPKVGRTTPAGHDEQLVQRTNLTAADVPPNWTECCPERFLSSSDLHDPSACIDAALLAPLVAGDVRQFALDLDQNGMEKGHVMAILRSAESAAAATGVNRAIQSTKQDPCLVEGIEQDLKSQLPVDAIIHPSTVTTIDRHLPIVGSTRLVATPFTVNGTDHVHYVDYVTLTAGRLRASLQFDAVEPAALGEAAWEKSVAASGEPAILERAATKLTQAAGA